MGRKKEAESSSESDSGSSSSSSSSSFSDVDDKKSSKKRKLALKKKIKKEKKKQKKKEEKLKKSLISKEDYYNKNREFRVWLTEEKKKDFEDLSTKKAKELFNKFVKKWNKKKLSKKYYRGIDPYDITSSSRTKYRWSFSDLNNAELTNVRGKVCGWNSPATFSTFGKTPAGETTANQHSKNDQPIKSSRDKGRPKTMYDAPVDQDLDLGPMPEIPKEREPQFVKPLAPPAERASFLMGGGDDISGKIQARKRKLDAAKESKNEKYQNKLTAYQEKEAAKMKALLEVARATKSDKALW